jgi:hypothetical protein
MYTQYADSVSILQLIEYNKAENAAIAYQRVVHSSTVIVPDVRSLDRESSGIARYGIDGTNGYVNSVHRFCARRREFFDVGTRQGGTVNK